MNEHLRERVVRKLEGLSDERGYQVLDYIEFLESKYAERQAQPASIFARFSEAVEDRLRAGKVSASTIAETVSLMNRAMNALNGVATGVAAAGRSVASDLASATATRAAGSAAAGSTQANAPGSAPTAGASGAPVASTPAGSGATAGPPPPSDEAPPAPNADRRATESGELEPPLGR